MKPTAFNYDDFIELKAENEKLKAELEHYEGLKEQGRMIELPCKVGDAVWTNLSISGWFLRQKDRPYEARVVFIGLNDSKDMGYGYINVLYRNGNMFTFDFSDIGKSVFLTREEAEKALEVLK